MLAVLLVVIGTAGLLFGFAWLCWPVAVIIASAVAIGVGLYLDLEKTEPDR